MDDIAVKCKIPCDYCGELPAFWFGATSVAVCGRPECRRKNQENWEHHLEIMQNEYEAEDYGK